MPESKVIPTATDYSVSGSSISITSFYQEPNELPDTLLADISETVGIQDGVSYIEGELLIKVKNRFDNINYSLNNNGNLILIVSTGDGGKYSIDDNGHLVYELES